MKIYRKVLELLETNEPVALLLVVAASGSTPQRAGAKAIADRQGTLLAGTIGGGLMESKALATAVEVLRQDRPQLLEFQMDEPYDREAGPICGGVMRIFAAPCRPQTCAPYRRALEAVEARERGLLLTTIAGPDAGRTRWLGASEIHDSANPADKQFFSFLSTQRSGTVLEPQTHTELFVAPVSPPPRMLIVGGGHVGQAVVQQAAWLGFEVTLLDDRPQFAQANRFAPGTRIVCGPIAAEVERFAKNADSYIVLVSKGHRPDAEALERCIHSEAAYIGMIGSARKVALLRKHFVESGFASDEQFTRVHAPIGLDIGAVTVEEIATSIMAQVVAVRRAG